MQCDHAIHAVKKGWIDVLKRNSNGRITEAIGELHDMRTGSRILVRVWAAHPIGSMKRPRFQRKIKESGFSKSSGWRTAVRWRGTHPVVSHNCKHNVASAWKQICHDADHLMINISPFPFRAEEIRQSCPLSRQFIDLAACRKSGTGASRFRGNNTIIGFAPEPVPFLQHTARPGREPS